MYHHEFPSTSTLFIVAQLGRYLCTLVTHHPPLPLTSLPHPWGSEVGLLYAIFFLGQKSFSFSSLLPIWLMYICYFYNYHFFLLFFFSVLEFMIAHDFFLCQFFFLFYFFFYFFHVELSFILTFFIYTCLCNCYCVLWSLDKILSLRNQFLFCFNGWESLQSSYKNFIHNIIPNLKNVFPFF